MEQNQLVIEDLKIQNLNFDATKVIANLSCLSIKPQQATKYFSEFANFKNLQELRIFIGNNKKTYYGNESQYGLTYLGQALENLINIENIEINLSESKLNNEVAGSLGSAIADLHQLKVLQLILDRNKISFKGASFLASSIAKCVNLQYLYLNLDNNKLDKLENNESKQSQQFDIIHQDENEDENDEYESEDENDDYESVYYDKALKNIILKTKRLIRFEVKWNDQSRYYDY
ncbi:hypothetical protein TTHERM_00816220 (macronuclear) [Tetrahymena thermophila SB210]|uniref:Kinase domain protein n=1 Tax=Tetrahymena thermophila (strain SB210) TaxID=312017 RepID=Q23HC4_TETTS|nr:hypothetical protein TTHERM_00816220 [Tetrahymena thermophila SB210]EAR95884.2 hypothetical protein TTHERM_00816220 [Tetrahymena thermophila SB210]|eukprot:XP_001016129.2 hypothetical protein TTHERM_00816220 [Tetrahymena thermophila SB210]